MTVEALLDSEKDPQTPYSSDSEPLFYREFLAERDEILKNKWVLSEEAGRDVGFDVALIDWVAKHRQKWLKDRKGRKGGMQGDCS